MAIGINLNDESDPDYWRRIEQKMWDEELERNATQDRKKSPRGSQSRRS